MSTQERILAVPVRLALDEGAERNGSLMLLGAVRPGAEPVETVLDLVNSPRRTVPFCPVETDELELVERDRIEWIAIDREVEGALVCPPDYGPAGERAIRLEFLSGTAVEAVVLGPPDGGGSRAAPPSPGRAGRFLPFGTGAGTLIANGSRIRAVRVLAARAPLTPSARDGGRGEPGLAAATLVQEMMSHGEGALPGEAWSRVRDTAAVAFARVADVILEIRDRGPADPAGARMRLESQKDSATLLLLGCEGIGFLAAGRLLGGALQSIREKVNEALGFELVV